ncbi:hypothetical protein SAMN02745121_08957 [Nannocystis exedens]|uniref:Uncharacterized protein n=1 Tax=Nannocystis exedens TaxID=54 RepID=A0A1I2IT33_9BACT|nr:hypothetical protein [Nannocystis exedens]PCC67224.1 hypothetical protein NAEX_00227 [Nannocystis exedens]SFF45434.1 hypothetical protein SAMN02745121_08957 [Nannocystis exedens]
MKLRAAALLALLCFACKDDEDPAEDSVDPRCKTLCTVQEPAVSFGQFDVCSPASVEQCERDCAMRVADVSTSCGSCQLEKASFEAPYIDIYGQHLVCEDGGCVIEGPKGSCPVSNNNGVGMAKEECLRQIFPSNEVECAPSYRDITECSALCGSTS